MPVEIISVGSEYIIQRYQHAGVAVIANLLLEAGIEIDYVSSVIGQESRLEDVLRQSIERSTLIFVIGNVSSGEYDVAKKLLTRVLKKRLVLNYKVLDALKKQFEAQGEVLPRTEEKRALVPTQTEMLESEQGIVPGFLFSEENKHVVLVPGDETDIEFMLKTHILPRLDPKTFRLGAASGLILKTCGLPLMQIKDRLRSLEREDRQQSLTYVSDGEEISIIVSVRGDLQQEVETRLTKLEAQIRQKLGNVLYGKGSQTLEEVVGKLLGEKKRSLALAESCTGGLIANLLTNIPGSSDYFDRGVVSYSNEAKISLLDVSPNIIEQHGAVSAETATAMAEGVRWLAQTSYGLAVTGIAGPSGGTPIKPVGLVYLALASDQTETQWKCCQFSGDRLMIKKRTAQTALEMLRHQLLIDK
ncbi:putative competence-damage inducible protein [Candidatus Vecturithrix granuli]|uniref:CinA-like protein n=1 Tax=Vecturithrix granuli TaxID=1499967 RepID=A0A081C9G7_VECG1|nr:putative competence-damage inducible protein [Candidatus Vecturithrix granuli]